LGSGEKKKKKGDVHLSTRRRQPGSRIQKDRVLVEKTIPPAKTTSRFSTTKKKEKARKEDNTPSSGNASGGNFEGVTRTNCRKARGGDPKKVGFSNSGKKRGQQTKGKFEKGTKRDQTRILVPASKKRLSTPTKRARRLKVWIEWVDEPGSAKGRSEYGGSRLFGQIREQGPIPSRSLPLHADAIPPMSRRKRS